MFKDKYKKDNDMINPSQETLEELKKNINNNKLKSSKVKIFVPLVAALVLIPLAFGIFSKIKNTNSNYDNNVSVLSENSKIKEIYNYEEIYDYLAQINKKNNSNDKSIIVNSSDREVATYNYEETYANNAVDSTSSNKDFTDTNVQVQGVQEADIIKTDGDYIYYIRGNMIYIVKANKGDTEIISKIECEEEKGKNTYIQEMYVAKDKLLVVRNVFLLLRSDDYYEESYCNKYNMGQIGSVYIDIYDISNKEKPQKISSLGQSGNYLSSRMIEDKLYVCTNKNVNFNNVKKDDKNTFIPEIFENNQEILIDSKDIYIQKDSKESRFLVMASIDLENPKKLLQTKAILGSGQDMYVNQSNMYIVSTRTEEDKNIKSYKSDIVKLSLNDGNVEYKCSASVDGTILNQFSMDEYDGYFRIVTTMTNRNVNKGEFRVTDNRTNGLFVLDENLNIVGSITGVAKGEKVYSVRFDQDIAYFVTFKNIDPLFAVDVSNPKEPKILGELKISGFSEYMHPYSDNLLLGLGKEADESNGRVLGLKLSMFDVKDKTNIIEKDKKVFEEYDSSSFYNHKAITIIKEKGIISFPVYEGYLIFKYSEENGFNLIKQIEDDYQYSLDTRGVYIDGYLYLLSETRINVYNQNFELIKNLIY